MNGRPSLAWHAAAAAQVAREVACDPRGGLSARRGRAWWVRLLLQFRAPLVYILLVAGAVTLWLSEYTDSAVILGVVLLEPGDKMSVALRPLDGAVKDLRIDESTLTGKSKTVSKDAAGLVCRDTRRVLAHDAGRDVRVYHRGPNRLVGASLYIHQLLREARP